ncbi:MAG: PD40 domain-containing protein [Chitinophagaceae bacterium]|nr:PD40 domain-containing protein [Chitinophagaceae bacterium]
MSRIFLFINIKENKTNLTNTGIKEASPLWSSDGKFMYFTCNAKTSLSLWDAQCKGLRGAAGKPG